MTFKVQVQDFSSNQKNYISGYTKKRACDYSHISANSSKDLNAWAAKKRKFIHQCWGCRRLKLVISFKSPQIYAWGTYMVVICFNYYIKFYN